MLRSLLTLKALTYAPTGGIVAALTTFSSGATGLAAAIGITASCWLRDATLTLIALMQGGYTEEAEAWRAWLHRAVAGNPDELQIMYGIAGERRLVEWSPGWLPGYQGASPVRIGNARLRTAATRRLRRSHGRAQHRPPTPAWQSLKPPGRFRCASSNISKVSGTSRTMASGEVRGARRHFTHSKVMAWLAVDRALRDAEIFGMPAPVEHWRALRDHMHEVICEKGFNKKLNSFTSELRRYRPRCKPFAHSRR